MTEAEFYKLHHKQIYGMLNHPYCTKRGTILEHRLEVEKVIGRYLTPKEVVHHHYNADGSATLILCPDKRYHMLLHTREESLRRCGNANWRVCVYCGKYDDPKNLSIKQQVYHKKCNNKYIEEYRYKLKIEKEELNDIKR